MGVIAIIGILAVQTYWVIQTWNQKEQQFQQSVHIALLNVVNDLAKVNRTDAPTLDIISQPASNYFVVNINNFINTKDLEYFLQKQLEAVAVREDFEYGIFECDTKQMTHGAYITLLSDKTQKVSEMQNSLPTYDKFHSYFGVRFPRRTTFLLSSMWLTLLFSLILLIAVAFFLYSIFIILRQKRLSEMQKDFINNMTHEFKTPISTINISADMFLNNPTIQENKRLLQYANIIKEQNMRLNSQVEKVLQLAKIEKDNFELNLEKVDLNNLITNILESIEIKIADQNGHLETHLNAQNPIVLADKLHLTNILHNLLDNAIKYKKEVPEITISTENKDNMIILSIIDKGIGIAKEHQNKIFNKFYRVPTGNVHNVKGFGLGLFYVKNVCSAHKWKIQLESEADKGTTLLILIKNIIE